jgi:hypothetical protein
MGGVITINASGGAANGVGSTGGSTSLGPIIIGLSPKRLAIIAGATLATTAAVATCVLYQRTKRIKAERKQRMSYL